MDYLTYKKGFLPSDFWWKAVLGSKVTFYHLDLFFHSQHFRTMLQEKVDINDRFLCGFHRVWLTNTNSRLKNACFFFLNQALNRVRMFVF